MVARNLSHGTLYSTDGRTAGHTEASAMETTLAIGHATHPVAIRTTDERTRARRVTLPMSAPSQRIAVRDASPDRCVLSAPATVIRDPEYADGMMRADGAYAVAEAAVVRYVFRGRTSATAGMTDATPERTSVDDAGMSSRRAVVDPDALADAAQAAVIAWTLGPDAADLPDAPETVADDRARVSWWAVVAYRAATAHGMTGQTVNGRRAIADADRATLSLDAWMDAGRGDMPDTADAILREHARVAADRPYCRADVACPTHAAGGLGAFDGCPECDAAWAALAAGHAARTTATGGMRKSQRGPDADADAFARTVALLSDDTLTDRARAAAAGVSYAAWRKRAERARKRTAATD